MYRKLIPLALATFAVGTDNFVIAGLLPAIARDLHVATPVAGQLVTVFALTFAVSAAVLGAVTSSMSRRSVLLLALAIFVVGNVCTALMPGYFAVLVARIITAAGAGMITSAASSTAAAVAGPEQQGRALAVVIGGLTAATPLGLPLGTLVGMADWRITLWSVAGVGALALIGVAVSLPAVTLPHATLRQRLAPMARPWVVGVLIITILAMAGTYVLYTYIASALSRATGGTQTILTLVLCLWGVGLVAGTFVAGRLSDRYPPARVLAAALLGAIVLLCMASLMTAALGTALIWALLWGFCAGIPIIPQQHRLVAFAPDASSVLLGLNSSASYLGISAGSALGALAQRWMPPTHLGYAAAAVLAPAFVITVTTATRRTTTSSGPACQPVR